MPCMDFNKVYIMGLNFRFAVVSDPAHRATSYHLGSSQSVPFREVVSSSPRAIMDTEAANIDFLLLPGDLTQHGGRDNHAWLQKR
jgi:3',5'-cyclic AMP phosphodiesterase CpdA